MFHTTLEKSETACCAIQDFWTFRNPMSRCCYFADLIPGAQYDLRVLARTKQGWPNVSDTQFEWVTVTMPSPETNQFTIRNVVDIQVLILNASIVKVGTKVIGRILRFVQFILCPLSNPFFISPDEVEDQLQAEPIRLRLLEDLLRKSRRRKAEDHLSGAEHHRVSVHQSW